MLIYFTIEKLHCKQLLEQYAKTHNFDPQVADNWYAVQQDDFLKVKVCSFSPSLPTPFSLSLPSISSSF